MQQAIEDCVRQSRIANGLVPLIDRQLAGDQGGVLGIFPPKKT